MNIVPIAITQGDPAGIGPEIIAKAFRDAPDLTRGCFVVGDVAIMRRAVQFISGPGRVGIPVGLIDTAAGAWQAPPRCIPVLPIPGASRSGAPVALGVVSALAGQMAADCVIWAAQAALRGEIAALVTAPVHKEALAAAGVPYPGHTELLQALAAAHLGKPVSDVPVRMLLANDELQTVLVSIHVSLRDAIEAVTTANLLQTLRLTHQFLHRVVKSGDTNAHPPLRARIGVAGLNPHAGEGGLFGREELDIIQPAIALAQAEGIDVHGPFAPDTVFMRARAKPGEPGEFDVVVAMYHDQGLIPVKYLGVEKGVNVTIGLPLVRTSPDHGTAFDIAGTGQADASSLIAAIGMARQLCK
jgi:4-hydroxythreonine-4-phosphate dehydrogenase